MIREEGKQTSKPVYWNEEMMLPLELPVSNDNLGFLFYDSDFPNVDDMICGINFSIKQIIKESDQSKVEPDEDGNIKMTPKMRYVNLYGCSKEHCGITNLKKSYK